MSLSRVNGEIKRTAALVGYTLYRVLLVRILHHWDRMGSPHFDLEEVALENRAPIVPMPQGLFNVVESSQLCDFCSSRPRSGSYETGLRRLTSWLPDWGRWGIFTNLSFKVTPTEPAAHDTLGVECKARSNHYLSVAIESPYRQRLVSIGSLEGQGRKPGLPHWARDIVRLH